MILFAKVALGMTAAAVAGAGALCSEGFVHVKVVEKQPHGVRVNVVAPAMLAPIAVRLAPHRDLAQATREIRPYMTVICAAMESLRESDDLVLVEVNEPGQHVRVAKWAGSIVVDVDDQGETVHVSTPIRAIANTLEQLAAGSSNSL